jgi:hypothetical protein
MNLSDIAVIIPSGRHPGDYGVSVCDLGMLVAAIDEELPLDQIIEHAAFDGTMSMTGDRVGKEILQLIARLKVMQGGGDYWAELPDEEV